MPLKNAARRQPINRTAHPIHIIAVALALALSAPHFAYAKADPSWVGKTVVRTAENFTLQSEEQPAQAIESPSYLYLVERTKGDLLWLKPEDNASSGWAPADHVVPLEEAIEFITKRVRADPDDVFSYVMRGTIWAKKNEFDKTIADYNDAIRLDANIADAYAGRAFVWIEKNEFDKAVADCTEAIRVNPTLDSAYGYRGNA
jgi:tetratricopeptide (TPR) repeat protein